MKPAIIALPKRVVDKVKKGKATSKRSEKLHPLIRAKMSPDNVIDIAKRIVPIFSPKAFYIDMHSFPILAESSEGLFLSNQAQSCLKIAARYFVLVFLTILSLDINKNEL
jgi:hypothetical protein